MPQPQQVYKNRTQALSYLQAQGYGVGQDKFYKDVKAGKCHMRSDKSIELADLLLYVNAHLQPVSNQSNDDQMARRRQQLEIEKLEQSVEKSKLENRKEDRRWIWRDTAQVELAATIGLLYDTIKHHIHIGSTQVAHAAGAEQARSGEIEASIEDLLDQAFNEFAGQKLVDLEFMENNEARGEK